MLFLIFIILLFLPAQSDWSDLGLNALFEDPWFTKDLSRSSQLFECEPDEYPGPRRVVSFVNGIYHSRDEWAAIADNLERIFECRVMPFYNPTSGWWADFSKATFERYFKKPADEEVVVNLTAHLRTCLDYAGKGGRVLHIAHSGGAILTYLCAKRYLTTSERARIDVTTFGGGRSLTRKYFTGRTINYYARNDPLLLVDSRAQAMSKMVKNETWDEVVYTKHNTSFIFLKGQLKNPIADHGMEGPTYGLGIEREAILHKERHVALLEILSAEAPEVDWVRIIRKRMAKVTGMRRFFSRDKFANVTRDTQFGSTNILRMLTTSATTMSTASFQKVVAVFEPVKTFMGSGSALISCFFRENIYTRESLDSHKKIGEQVASDVTSISTSHTSTSASDEKDARGNKDLVGSSVNMNAMKIAMRGISAS